MAKERTKGFSSERRKLYQHQVAFHFAHHHKKPSDLAYNEVVVLTDEQVHHALEKAGKAELSKDDVELLKAIKSRFTPSELQQLRNGAVLHNDGVIRLNSDAKHHKIGVISDTHIGSIYAPDEWLQYASDTFVREGCELIIHCGDLTEGMKAGRLGTQMYEIEKDCLGYPAMRDASVRAFERFSLPIYIISGNHDRFFQDNADIVQDVAARLPNMHYLGNSARECIPIVFDGAKVLLFHGLDGFSNTRLKNLAYSEQVGLNNISLVLAGHVHKFEEKFIDGCYMFNVPCMQKQTGWMRGKKLYADCGFLILEFDVADQRVINLKTQFYNL